jgi:FkbM family methyltransferase
MFNPFKILIAPEYLFQPKIVLRRFQRLIRRPGKMQHVMLPWGADLSVNPNETIGSIIWCYGLFDLIVVEVLWRLLEKGEVALDVGANIGQMTSLMGVRLGSAGRVYAFEAHPQIYETLKVNLARWQQLPNFACVKLFHAAVTFNNEPVLIEAGANWNDNRGTAKVATNGVSSDAQTFKISGLSLDKALEAEPAIGVCKIDVEGHEEFVLRGGADLLKSKRIRDIVFEEWGNFPATTHKLLADCGYQIFSLRTTVLKPQIKLLNQSARHCSKDGWNYLATLDARRAWDKFKPFGWKVLLNR